MGDHPFNRSVLDRQLFDWLRLGDLADLPAHDGQTVEDWTAVLDLADRLSREKLAPHWRASDQVEPWLDNGIVRVEPGTRAGVQAWMEAGLHLAGVPEDEGGMALPFTVVAATMAMSMAAHIAAASFPMLSVANSRVIRSFGTDAQIKAFAEPQHEARALGTMCLSEPAVGSSLGDVSTRAIPDGADALGPRYRLRGVKMWISAGGQDIAPLTVHLVLAKAEQPDGTLVPGSRGLLLFAVPSVLPDGTQNDVTVTGLNHKMGWRGTPNCVLAFGDKGGAQGWRIGDEGQGLPIMFQMMNEARIGVGIGAAALAWRGYLASRNYAQERVQGRALDDKDAEKPVPLTRHPDVRRMLLAQKAIAEGSLAMCLYAARLVDLGNSGDAEAETLLGLLTPIVKSWPSEMGLVANHYAIQIHGGYGYTRDFEVEQIYRDNRLNPIHEGTTGIQGIDLLGRKLLFDRSGAFDLLSARIRETEARAAEEMPEAARALAEAREVLTQAITASRERSTPADALANATQVLSAAGHVVAGWLLLDLALLDAPDKPGRVAACRYFSEFELPHVRAWLSPVIAASDLTMQVEDAWL
ncbi:acyl-CoA dehydrogenase [Thioclava dalianensis]|uniref:Acyl-CoA dehydrogenase n=1 Tax=Thioclava dalianensis TaxID=1185766 RepID=A0A074TFQ0_9RHOB|nr:acyl-CoA dehydrogenase [Thioclava dalianensis]KEP67843.1 acyl-CoA dehydrogenase [Thioclava dalianensis]SFN94296.1 Acyl-CoA dehydrogenase [Thioclava dalianensis]